MQPPVFTGAYISTGIDDVICTHAGMHVFLDVRVHRGVYHLRL